jgi:ribose transport system permease protein
MAQKTEIDPRDAAAEPVPSAGGPTAAHVAKSTTHGPNRGRLLVERYAVLLILLVVVIVFSILEPKSFATKDNAISIVQQQSVLACLALGLLIPIAIGEFDLSVGYVLGFSAIVAAKLGGSSHLPGGAIILICLGIGLAIGCLNGLFVARFKVHSLIATLGVGFAVSGATIGVSGSQTLFQGIPDAISKVSSTQIFTVDLAVWIVLVLAIVMNTVLVHTPFGRRIYAIGGSERVARLAGVRTNLIKIAAFGLAGLFAATAGLLQLGESGAANPSFGINLLLPAFAAIFLGATTIKPGYFNVWGTIVAILLLAAGFNGLGLVGVPLWVEPIFDGTVLLVAVLFARAEARSLGRAT